MVAVIPVTDLLLKSAEDHLVSKPRAITGIAWVLSNNTFKQTAAPHPDSTTLFPPFLREIPGTPGTLEIIETLETLETGEALPLVV
jgi:hypothetical protein